ncbi:MAG: AlbA family DNA-binding domain-containing protein, partial [bacterium]
MTEADLLSLIAARVMEDRTVEYKEALPGGTDSDKREFLADVSSFANSSGGNLYFGIRELEGIPVELVGLDLQDADATIQRIENLIRDGIEPRLPPLRIEKVELSS